MKIILIPILTLSLSSCMLSGKDSNQINPIGMNQGQNSTSGIIDNSAIVTSETIVPSTDLLIADDGKNMKTYNNPHYGISFNYPIDFNIISHSGVMSWDDSGNVDEFEDNVVFSGSRGKFTLILPDDSTYTGGAPLFGEKDETIMVGNLKVQKHIEFGSQDNPGPNQQGTWVLRYIVDIGDKKYKFSTNQDGVFGTYSISEELDFIIQDIIKSIK